MRAVPLALLLGACGPGATFLESGSYVPADGGDELGLDGVNLTLDQELVLFVTADAIVPHGYTDVPEDDWVVGCEADHPKGVLEQTLALDPEPVELPEATVTFTTLSAYCGEGGGIRLVATDPALELVLVPF